MVSGRVVGVCGGFTVDEGLDFPYEAGVERTGKTHYHVRQSEEVSSELRILARDFGIGFFPVRVPGAPDSIDHLIAVIVYKTYPGPEILRDSEAEQNRAHQQQAQEGYGFSYVHKRLLM